MTYASDSYDGSAYADALVSSGSTDVATSGAYYEDAYYGGGSAPAADIGSASTGSLAGAFPEFAGSLAGSFTSGLAGSLAGAFPQLGGSLDATFTPASISGTISGSFPQLAGVLDGNVFEPGLGGFLAGSFPTLEGEFYGAPQTSLDGLVLVDLSTTNIEAPTETVEDAVVLHVVTPTVPAPALVGGRPQ